MSVPFEKEGRPYNFFKIHPITLSFIGECALLEPLFLDYYSKHFLKQARLILLISLFLYGAFGILDAVIVPELKYQFWFIRFGVVCPFFIYRLYGSYTPTFIKNFQMVMVSIVLIASAGIIYMTTVSPDPARFTYTSGLMLILMLCYTFGRARFVYASITCSFVIFIYFLAAKWVSHLEISLLANTLFFLTSANLIGMVACYSLEYYLRKDFYTSQLLKHEQEKVKTINTELEEMVKTRTQRLDRANNDLLAEIKAHRTLAEEKKQLEAQLHQSQKMEAIGTLAGGIAHDFNNILAAIIGYTELAVDQINETQIIEKHLSEVLNASLRAKHLVRRILSFSHQENSEDLQPIKISTIIDETIRFIRAPLPATIAIETHIIKEDGIVIADATQMHQVLMNLCTNASQAMQPDGGVLSIQLDSINIAKPMLLSSDRYIESGKYAKLVISDTGHGISQRNINRIFNPYFTTKKKGVGTGLGLAVVQGILQNHGGVIDVESTENEGTSFIIYLPQLKQTQTTRPQALPSIKNGPENMASIS